MADESNVSESTPHAPGAGLLEGALPQAPAAHAENEGPGESPQKYQFKTPEGVAFPADIMSGFEEEARALKLNQEQAQKLFDIGTKAVAAHQREAVDAWGKYIESETRALETDPRLGGKNYAETRAVALRAYNGIKRTLSPQSQQALDQMMIAGRMANFRPVAEFLHALGQRFFREDSPVLDNTGPGRSRQPDGFNYDSVKSVFGRKQG